jgi:2-isopropylmalate synthase
MSVEAKIRLFQLLVRLGFKQIEVGFPGASQVEYDFVRRLITEDLCPDDVYIQVLTPARADIIRTTIEAVRGARRVIIHLYNSTSPVQRELVFGLQRQETIDLAVRGVGTIRSLSHLLSGSEVRLEYSPESFTATEPEFALEICEAVLSAWDPGIGYPVILNLPATVELSTPNVYADQIEWFCTNLCRPEATIVSVHPHNDRGTAVAAAELALLAGARRVEGTLFGNGERTGNVDLVCLAVNMLAHGIDPALDFSDLPMVISEYEATTRMKVPPRQPYSGDLVFTAFSGSHQDAIRKTLAAQRTRADGLWNVPYLPVDPADIGRTYEAIIRVNGQSGKSGIAYVMEEMGYTLPRSLQIELRTIVQRVADSEGGEISKQRILALFEQKILEKPGRFRLIRQETAPQSRGAGWNINLHVEDSGIVCELVGTGLSVASAAASALTTRLNSGLHSQELMPQTVPLVTNGSLFAWVEARDSTGILRVGVGRAMTESDAVVRAVISLVNRTTEVEPQGCSMP